MMKLKTFLARYYWTDIRRGPERNNKAVYAFEALNEETDSRTSWIPTAREKLTRQLAIMVIRLQKKNKNAN